VKKLQRVRGHAGEIQRDQPLGDGKRQVATRVVQDDRLDALRQLIQDRRQRRNRLHLHLDQRGDAFMPRGVRGEKEQLLRHPVLVVGVLERDATGLAAEEDDGALLLLVQHAQRQPAPVGERERDQAHEARRDHRPGRLEVIASAQKNERDQQHHQHCRQQGDAVLAGVRHAQHVGTERVAFDQVDREGQDGEGQQQRHRIDAAEGQHTTHPAEDVERQHHAGQIGRKQQQRRQTAGVHGFIRF
jgi:hypothetical protein